MPLRRLGSLNSAAQVRLEAGEKLRLQLEAAFSLWGPQSFVFSPSADWTRPTHIMAGNLLYSESTGLNVNHI